MDVHPLIWVAFVVFVLAMLFIDLFLFHREAHAVSAREGAMWVAIWMSMGLGFTAIIAAWQGGTGCDERGPEDESTDDAPEEHTVLQDRRNREIRKDQDEDEDVVS